MVRFYGGLLLEVSNLGINPKQKKVYETSL